MNDFNNLGPNGKKATRVEGFPSRTTAIGPENTPYTDDTLHTDEIIRCASNFEVELSVKSQMEWGLGTNAGVIEFLEQH